jgi:hypothetical protein
MRSADQPSKTRSDWAIACVQLSWVVVACATFECYRCHARWRAAMSNPSPFAVLDVFGASLGYGIVGNGGLIVSVALLGTPLCFGGRSRLAAFCTLIIVGLLGLLWWLMSF